MDTTPSTALTSKYLQSRISFLTTTLIKRFENILALSLDDITVDDEGNDTAAKVSIDTLANTKQQQLQMGIETAALVRGAEELLVLGRGMKECWAFGRLDVGLGGVEGDVGEGGDGKGGEAERTEEMELRREEERVREEMERWLEGYCRRRREEKGINRSEAEEIKGVAEVV
jgi:hypothetical protein